EFAEVLSKPIRSLPYDTPGQTFVVFEKPEGVLTVGKFSNMLKFISCLFWHICKHSKYQLSIILISTVIVLSSEPEEFAKVLSTPIRSLPYDTLG
ncbi:coatomer subunit gamma, partial [Quercus suber]